MTQIPELQRLAQRHSPDPEAALVQILRLLCEQLNMSTAVLGSVHEGVHTVDFAVRAGQGRDPSLEVSRPVGESLCGLVGEAAPLVVRDIAAAGELADLALVRELSISCYAGVRMSRDDGTPVGILGLLGDAPHPRLDDRDVGVLEGLAAVVGDQYDAWRSGALTHPGPTPTPTHEDPTEPGESLAEDLEGLTRPLLDALHELSGIASTYLTKVDAVGDRQQLLLAHNAKAGFDMPEQAVIPWEHSMCWLAIEEGTPAVFDLPARWPQVAVAAKLGIVTHVSVPIHSSDGALWGTLCASDNVAHPQAATQLPTLRLFARLITADVERAAGVTEERARARVTARQAQVDELTGCASRRMVEPWLTEAYRTAGPDELVAVAFVDVDRFKTVNDERGHAVGDELLAALGQRLRNTMRPEDLVARQGGDEFVVGVRLRRASLADFEARMRDTASFRLSIDGDDLTVRCSTGFATSDTAADPASLLDRADSGMYRDKSLLRR